MNLERSRDALRQATQKVEELRAAKDNPDLFRDRFSFAVDAVRRVGYVIAAETEGNRTPQFGDWWKKTQNEPMFRFINEVRVAAHKRGERRAIFVQFASASLGIEMGGSATAQVIDRDGRVVEDAEPPPPPPEPPPPGPSKAATDLPPQWEFVGEGKFKGGEFDGHEVFALLDRYIAWLRDDILPTAEALTR
jgi:hypothetical protein